MLQFLIVHHPDQIKSILDQFNPHATTWIVSDLKSKQDIQNHIVSQAGYYFDDSILRISDFWKMWLRRLSPATHVVSTDFIQALVSKFVDIKANELSELTKNESNATFVIDGQTLYKYVSDLAPLLLHPQSHDILMEWMAEKTKESHWGKWITISQMCIDYIINEYNCIESAWVVSFLQKLNIEKITWPKKIIIDLGSQMTSLEMGLLNTMSRQNSIQVIVPDPTWKNKFNYTLNTYKDYSGFASVQKLNNFESVENGLKKFFRFNSEINEIKFATVQVRQWIEQGIQPEKIVILSPRIEDYWPFLQFHLASEGVLTQKPVVSSYISLGVIQRWLSTIQAQTKNVSWSKLEMSYANHQNIPFEKFKAAFFEIIDDRDLARLDTIETLYYNKINIDEKIFRDQFLIAMLQSWIDVDPQLEYKKILHNLVKDFIQQTVSAQLFMSDWLKLLSARLAAKEHKIENGASSGLQVLPVNSAQVLNATHRLWIGLDDSGLKGRQNSLIPLADIEELKMTFDLALNYPEESHADFNLRWYSMSHSVEQVFTCSHVSLSGEPLNASLFFLENNKDVLTTKTEPTYVDDQQLEFLATYEAQLEPAVSYKLKLELAALPLPIQNLVFESLSPTDLEVFDQCSFKFLARRGYRLKQYDQMGLEIDPRQKGNLIHDLFKFIIQDRNYLSLDKQQLSDYLEKERVARQMYPFLDVFWLPQKEKLLQLGLKFIETEKSRLQFLENIKHYTEQEIAVFFDLDIGEFTTNKPLADHYLIRGRLDRLDIITNQQQAVVIDYKSSKTSETHFHDRWLDNAEFQLLLYSIAVEKIYSAQVVSALYYFYKNLEHKYGYILDEDHSFLPHVNYSKKTLINNDQLTDLKDHFQNKIKDVLLKIRNLEFSVNPQWPRLCDQCEWTDVCRIKNLK